MRKISSFTEDEIREITKLYVEDKINSPEIAKMYDTDKGVIRYLLTKKAKIKMRPYCNSGVKYHFKEDYFDNIDTPNKAYILGILYADGNVDVEKYHRMKLTLWDIDKPLLEDIRKELGMDKPLNLDKANKEKNKNRHDAWDLVIYSKHLTKRLNELGCMPRKSLILNFPNFIPENLMSHFLRGYFDGDGSISMKTRGLSINFTSSTNFCNGLNEYFNNMGIDTRITPTDNPQTSRVVSTRKEESLKVLKYIYEDLDENLYMKRKYDNYQEKLKQLKLI